MLIEWNDVEHKPKIVATSKQLGDAYYTLTVHDPDAPNPAFVHYMRVNICGKHMDRSRTCLVVPWMSPSPPSGETHRYVVRLTRQNTEWSPCPVVQSRSRFNIHDVRGHCVRTIIRLADSTGFV